MFAAGKVRAASLLSGGGGGGGGPVSISNKTVTAMGGGLQRAGYRLAPTAIAQGVVNGVPYTLETWLLAGSASSYEVRVTDLTGNLFSGTTGSWLNLGTAREWELRESESGSSLFTELLVEIRAAATPGVILDTATITLNAFIF